MTTEERCPLQHKNGMMVVGRLKSDLTKVLWVEYRIPPGSDAPRPYLYVDADRDTKLYPMEDVDEDTMPIGIMEQYEKRQNAAKAKNLDLFARFDNVKTALEAKDLRRLARLFRKLHPLGWEPTPRMLKKFRKDPAEKGCLPHDHPNFVLFMDPLNKYSSTIDIDFKKNELGREPDGDRVEHRDVLTMALPAGLVEERKNDPDKLREELYHTVDVFVNSVMNSTE